MVPASKLASYAEMPAGMRAAIEARNPSYKEPPPVDDARPNETSWSYFKKMLPPPEAQVAGDCPQRDCPRTAFSVGEGKGPSRRGHSCFFALHQ